MADKKDKVTTILTEIEGLTALELSELAKALEEKFGVSGMPVMAAAPVAGGSVPTAEASEEKSSYNVVLVEVGANKLNVIKVVRELDQSLGLMDAKKLVESAPKEVLKDAKKDIAEEAKKKLEAVGAKVELK